MGKKNPYKKRTIIKKYRANHQIRIPEVFVIDESGTKLGVMATQSAIAKAQEAGLDLIEVSPNTQPPVCKIMDFGNFQYKQSKRQKTNKQKKTEIKGIRLSLKIGKHDLDFREKQAQKFINQKNKVKIELTLRGRERQHKDLAIEIINNFIKNIENAEVEQNIKTQGGKLFVTIKPIK